MNCWLEMVDCISCRMKLSTKEDYDFITLRISFLKDSTQCWTRDSSRSVMILNVFSSEHSMNCSIFSSFLASFD